MSAQPTLRYISLFSGIGGFDLGFDRAGMTCVAQVEFNPQASEVLSRHWPDVVRFKDVCDVGASNLPNADVLVGGFPCQDVSVAGKRAGLAGERSGLWFEFLRILTELKPQFCVIENVPGLLSSNGGRDFAVILRGLVECGYRVSWRILDAQYFGVAQRRRRVFIVASFADGRAAEILFERDSGTGDSQSRRASGQGVAATVIKGSAIGREPENGPQRTEAAMLVVAEAIDVRNSCSNGDLSGTLQAKAQGYSLNYQNPVAIHAIDLQQVTSKENRSIPREQAPTLSRDSDVIAFTQNEREEVRDLGDRAGALAADPGAHQQNYIAFGLDGELNPSREEVGTLMANFAKGGGNPAMMANHTGVRRLTPTECERLQSFPDNWTAGQSDSVRYRQLGNAVCVNVAEWLAHRIIAVAQEVTP